MKPTSNDKLIAYLALISGIAISCIAEYYSIMGLIAIYPAASIPIIVMGVVLGFGKISGTVWTKQNWSFAPWFLKAYILPSILVLMAITSLGVFGFLSKAHSDQSLVSGDVQSKIAVYDEKIKTSKDNIDANRKALKQMDEAVDQVMGRSTSETGADKAVAIRRGQQKERSRLQSEIAAEQKTISQLSEERAPIAAEVRKVEAEVGPIKYIAHLFYGENPDANVLEKAVIWVTVLIVIVLDPLAVALLLASQYSFQRFREQEEEDTVEDVEEWFRQGKERARQLDQESTHTGFIAQEVDSVIPEAVYMDAEGDSPERTESVVDDSTTTVTESQDDESSFKPATVTYKFVDDFHEPDYPADNGPLTDEQVDQINASAKPLIKALEGEEAFKLMQSVGIFDKEGKLAPEYGGEDIPDVERPGDYLTPPDGYVQNEEQKNSNLWTKTVGSAITQEEYIKASQEHKK